MSPYALRPTRSGIVTAPVYLALSAAWLWLAPHPGPLAAYLAWAALLLVITLFLPGPANQVTISRAYLAVPGFSYALDHALFLPLALTIALAGLTDLVDGTVARRLDRPTSVGGALDPIVDGIFFGAVAVGLSVGFAYPAWLAAVVIARYALPALAGGLLLLGRRRVELRHTLLGQVSTTLIAALLGGVALFRGLGADVGPMVVGAEIVIPVATLLTFANLAWGVWRANSTGMEVEKAC